MATVHMTFTDTDTGGVEATMDFQPIRGASCSNAESVALGIFNRTRKEWGMSSIEVVHINTAAAASTAQNTNPCGCSADLTPGELDSGKCDCCGKAVLA